MSAVIYRMRRRVGGPPRAAEQEADHHARLLDRFGYSNEGKTPYERPRPPAPREPARVMLPTAESEADQW